MNVYYVLLAASETVIGEDYDCFCCYDRAVPMGGPLLSPPPSTGEPTLLGTGIVIVTGAGNGASLSTNILYLPYD